MTQLWGFSCSVSLHTSVDMSAILSIFERDIVRLCRAFGLRTSEDIPKKAGGNRSYVQRRVRVVTVGELVPSVVLN